MPTKLVKLSDVIETEYRVLQTALLIQLSRAKTVGWHKMLVPPSIGHYSNSAGSALG